MCQLQSLFHLPCAHWSPRPAFLGEPCVRARRIVVPSSSFALEAYITIPCDFPDALGAVDVQYECPDCVRRRREIDEDEDEDDAGSVQSSSMGSTTTSSSSSSSSWSSARSSCSSSGPWRPFAGLSKAGWEEVRKAQQKRRMLRRGLEEEAGGPVGEVEEMDEDGREWGPVLRGRFSDYSVEPG